MVCFAFGSAGFRPTKRDSNNRILELLDELDVLHSGMGAGAFTEDLYAFRGNA